MIEMKIKKKEFKSEKPHVWPPRLRRLGVKKNGGGLPTGETKHCQQRKKNI